MIRKLVFDLPQQEVGGFQLKRPKYSDLCDILPKVARERGLDGISRAVS